MSEASKPTPGPWRISQDDVVVRVAAKSAILYEQFLPEYGDDYFRREQKEACANAALIAEAGTVHQETGLTPRQLVDQIKAVESAMRDAREMIDADHVDAAYQMLGEAIANLVKGAKP